MAGYGSLVLGNTVVNHVAEMQTAQSASWLHGRPQPGGVEGLYLAHACTQVSENQSRICLEARSPVPDPSEKA